MDESRKKLRRVKPLIKARKNQVDTEATVLAKVRQEKLQIMAELNGYQNSYIQSIEDLNKERSSPYRERLAPLERSVDYVKAQWHNALKRLQSIENQERAQLAQLLIAERNLQSVEKLEERYMTQVVHAQEMQEQKTMDAAAIRKFIIKRD